MKMPGPLRNYLSSTNVWLKSRLPSRDRALHRERRCNSADCVGFDIDDGPLQSSNESRLSEEMIAAPGPIGFAIRGAANRSFDRNPFAEPIDSSNDAAAWMGLSVALSAFVLVFGGYVAVAGMGSSSPARNAAEALAPRGAVMGMTWLPGDLATFPETPAASAPQAAASPAQAAAVADARKTPKRDISAATLPARDRARSATAAIRRETTLRSSDSCIDKNQRGCFRRYATKAPSGNPFDSSSTGAQHMARDINRAAQVPSDQTLAPPRNASFYQHH
jgi:hypothetical protein